MSAIWQDVRRQLVFADGRGGARIMLLGRELADRADARGEVHGVRVKAIAVAIGLTAQHSDRQVQRILKQLLDAGVIERFAQFGPHGQVENLYRVITTWLLRAREKAAFAAQFAQRRGPLFGTWVFPDGSCLHTKGEACDECRAAQAALHT